MENLRKILSALPAIDPDWPASLIAFALDARTASSGTPQIFVHESGEVLEEVADTLRSLGVSALRFEPGNPLGIAQIYLLTPDDEEPFRKSLQHLHYRRVRVGDVLDPFEVAERLSQAGFERVPFVESPGEFAIRGGILDLYLPGKPHPVRIELFDDEILSLRSFDPLTQRSIQALESVPIPGLGESRGVWDWTPVREVPECPVEPNPPYIGRWDLLKQDLERLRNAGYQVVLFTLDRRHRMAYQELLGVPVEIGAFSQGFRLPQHRIAVFSDQEVKVTGTRRSPEEEVVPGERVEDLNALQPGDLVVYREYGIGEFVGLETVHKEDVSYDAVVIRYRDGEIRVPVLHLHKIHRFVHHGKVRPTLSSLSSGHWARRYKAVENAAWGLAQEILNQYAIRQLQRGYAFPPDDAWMLDLEASFPYELTPDQKTAIEAVKRDMESPQVMDRLVAGDVGFGKTEVALRAAFKAVTAGKQVIFLVPTTILALQHYENFRRRLEPFPIRVEMLSRLVPPRRVKEILKGLKEGTVDIVIGTHRLLQDDVTFKDPGLLIIDEEHRFGVLQKEKIRSRYAGIDTLRMTATPIPRTLYAALGKLYSLSTIETPPIGRQPVETIVRRYDPQVVKRVIEFEIARGGQVFYLHNRIASLLRVRDRLLRLIPDLRIGIAHGQMRERELEEVFLKFYRGELDVLLSTSIIESGLDFPRANTIIVENAHLFGLAELHQLRGRVGRSTVQAFAYFFVPKTVRGKALQRLRALKMYRHLGAGLRIAMADLEIRGAGNLLGVEQHGHARKVGYELFYYLLDRAVRTLSGEQIRDEQVEVVSKITALLPEHYIEEPWVRIAYYRRFATAARPEELDEVLEDLWDRFGKPPQEVLNLYDLHRIRLWALERGYQRVVVEHDLVEAYRAEGKPERFRKSLVLPPHPTPASLIPTAGH